MAWRLGEYVVYGELYNRRNYSTHGVIALRGVAPGEETMVRVDLTGDCGPDLRGKGFRFMPCGEAGGPIFDAEALPGFQMQQIGATGTMTAQGWVRVLPCGVEEYLRRVKLGEPPPTPWGRRLYLEWFSQNGRVVIELADPIVEEAGDDSQVGDATSWKPLPNLALPPDSALGKPLPGLEISIVRMEEDEAEAEHWSPDYGDDELEAAELMDYCIDHAESQPLRSFLHSDQLPPPERLDDEAVEAQLKLLLSELALVGVALDVCAHFTPRDCYRLLFETLLDEGGQYEELIGTGWVTHLCTWEHCPVCLAEAESGPDPTCDGGEPPS
jgi:hypothetical protein